MKLTFLWQNQSYWERDWIAEIFKPITGDHVVDGKHSIVVDNCLLIDSFLHGQPPGYYERFRGKNAWLLHLGDETYEGGYHAYGCFRGVFRNYWSAVFNPRRVMQIPLGYSAGFKAVPNTFSSIQRSYLWSFLGAANKSSRPEMIRALRPFTPQFVHITDRGNVGPLGKEQYGQVLRDSIFVPSSMGNVNLDCFRMYEALECGAIPILERRMGFNYFARLLGPHPLPAFADWASAARFLANIQHDYDAQDRLLAQCSQWWSGYKKDLSARIEDFIAHPAGDEGGSFVNWRRSIPGSQWIELSRHHTVPAFTRRIRVQVERVLREGKLRKTEGV